MFSNQHQEMTCGLIQAPNHGNKGCVNELFRESYKKMKFSFNLNTMNLFYCEKDVK